MQVIRFAGPDDWPFWNRLDGRIDQALFLRKLAAGECYIAEAERGPAGLLRWNRFWDELPFCTLLYIVGAMRGRGLGAALMARWEADMVAAGFDCALTSTQVDESAQHFYRKLGYRDVGGFVPVGPERAQPMELIMMKELTERT